MPTILQAATDRTQALMNYTRQQYAYTLAKELYGPTVSSVSFSGEYNDKLKHHYIYAVTGFDSNGKQLPYDLTTNFWKTQKIGHRGFQVFLLEDAHIEMENKQIPEEEQHEYLQDCAEDSLNDTDFFHNLQQALQLQEDETYDLRAMENLLPYTEQYAKSLEHLAKWLNFWNEIHDGYGSTAVCLHTELDPPDFRTMSYTILDQEGNELPPLLERSFWEPRKYEKIWGYKSTDEEDARMFFRRNYLSGIPYETRDYTINDDPSLFLPYLLQ